MENRVEQLRKSLNMDQEEFAKALRVSRQTMDKARSRIVEVECLLYKVKIGRKFVRVQRRIHVVHDASLVDEILIQPGKDMVTLLTCHPYASGGRQRYVVYCERTGAPS